MNIILQIMKVVIVIIVSSFYSVSTLYAQESIRWYLGYSSIPLVASGKATFSKDEKKLDTRLYGYMVGREKKFAENHAWLFEIHGLSGNDSNGGLLNLGYSYTMFREGQGSVAIVPKIGFGSTSFKVYGFGNFLGQEIKVDALTSGMVYSLNLEGKYKLFEQLGVFAQTGFQKSSFSSPSLQYAIEKASSNVDGLTFAIGAGYLW